MATSGTVGATVVQVDDLIGDAARAAGVPPVQLTLEDQVALKRQLFYQLSDLSSQGINLWCQERTLFGIYPGTAEYETPVGTVEVLQLLYRTPQRLADPPLAVTSSAGGAVESAIDGDVETVLTQVAPLGNVEFDFGINNDQTVRLVGLLPGATADLALVFETSPDAVTWRTVDTIALATYTDRVWAWLEILTAQVGRFFRVRATAGTLVMREISIAAAWRDVVVTRMSRDVYSTLPNRRTQTTRPLQYWLDRKETPVIVLWGEPTTTFDCMQMFRHRHIEDVGALSNTIECPQRWVPWVYSELARRAFFVLPKADMNRKQGVEAEAGRALAVAQGEERDRSPVTIGVRIGAYTR